MSIKYLRKEQDWALGNTTYWFQVDGADYGVVEGDFDGIVDGHGLSISGRDDEYEITMVLESAVTDEMRFQ